MTERCSPLDSVTDLPGAPVVSPAGLDLLPTITPELPGTGGVLKAEPAHFVVEEIPLYEASGSGAHLYVSLTREGWTTRRVADALADLFGLSRRDVGFAGLKDRNARCTQTFSLPGLAPEDADRIEPALPFQVHWARQHNNKLKVGHLLGNHFRITVTDLAVPPAEALSRSQAIAAAIAQCGVPNFFGPQRFGHEGGNVAKGRAALLGQGPRRDPWLTKLLISAYQSHLFNRYLTRRMAAGLFGLVLPGDVCKKADTGGMFEVEDAAAEQPRYVRGEITRPGRRVGGQCAGRSGVERRRPAPRAHRRHAAARPAVAAGHRVGGRRAGLASGLYTAQGRLRHRGAARVHQVGTGPGVVA